MKVTISKPYLHKIEGNTRLIADIRTEDDEFSLWIEVADQYAEYLVVERCDPFVVALLPWAMIKSKKYGKNVTLICTSPISAKLFHQLANYYIPILSDSISYYAPVQLEAETDGAELPCRNAVGTGVSGGVDSSYTIIKHKDNPLPHFKLSHVLYCNIGLGGGHESDTEAKIRSITQRVADDAGLEYIYATSNVCSTLYKAPHASIATAAYCSTPLALQKLFSIYNHSSTYAVNDFHFDEIDSEYYDLLTLSCISTECTTFYSSGMETTRLFKLAYIGDSAIAQNNLLVCLEPFKYSAINCSRCAKCSYTMAGLDLFGKLDNFSKVFDVESFRRDEGYHWGYILLKTKDDAICDDLVKYYLQKHQHIPLNIRWAAFTKWINRGFTRDFRSRRRVEDEIR